MKKLLIPTIALLLLLASVLCFGAAADGAEPSVAIPGHNLALEDSIHIIYYVDFQNVPAGAEKGVLIWTSPRSSYTYGTQNAKLTESTGEYGSYLKYEFTDVAAKMMAQDIYAVAYIKDGNSITYSALDKYSVLQYAMNKKTSTSKKSGGTATLGELVTGMLEYGATAQKYFNYQTDRLANAAYYQITVENGTLADGTMKGLYPVGTSLTLTAKKTGFQFVNWTNQMGDVVGTEKTLSVAVTAREIYTANYGETPDPVDYEETPELIIYSEGLTFNSNGDGTCYVSGIGTCTDTEIIIPPTSPAGDTVTSIGNGYVNGRYTGFYQCYKIRSVTIPDSVTSIGNSAFHTCTHLTSVTIGNGVTNIGSEAFCYCYDLREVSIGNSVTSIGNEAFNGCTGLTSITIPDSVTIIGSHAFSACTGLASITIPDSVTSIGSGAFYRCTKLTGITIPDSVTCIGATAFYCCTGLTSVYYAGDLAGWCGISFSGSDANPLTYAHNLYIDNQLVTTETFIIPDDVTSIGGYAFSGCSGFTSITISDSVTSIGEQAFCYCTDLTSVTWNAISCTVVISNFSKIFGRCDNLKTVVFGDQVTDIPSYVLKDCTGLTSITIPDSVRSIGSYAFYNCSNLTSITISDSVTSIEERAFYNCARLTSITIPDSVTSIGYEAFGGCTSLTSITIPDSVTSIGGSAFSWCTSLTSITYTGTTAQWNAISKGSSWNSYTGAYVIHCTDGDISK